MIKLRYALALLGWVLILDYARPAHGSSSGPHASGVGDEHRPKRPHDGVKAWPIVYTTNVARSDGAAGTCPVTIMTDGHEWPRPNTNYVAIATDPKCDPSGLAIHDNVTRNNAGPDQK